MAQAREDAVMHFDIDPTTLAAQLGRPDAPLILDVCLPEDVAADPDRIPSAFRIPHRDVTRAYLKNNLHDTDISTQIVVTCQRGAKLSLGAAARLHADGMTAGALRGGMVAWRDAGRPVTPDAALPASGLWVTAAERRTDAALIHWLIRRFSPPGGALLIVPRDAAADVAGKFNAIYIETPDALCRHLGLAIPALHTMIAAARPSDTALLADLLANAARANLGQAHSPALPLLDIAFATFAESVPA